jgi:hypothetical protein
MYRIPLSSLTGFLLYALASLRWRSLNYLYKILDRLDVRK